MKKETGKAVFIARELAAEEFNDQDSFLQTRLWARQKEAFGWKARYFRLWIAGPESGPDSSPASAIEASGAASLDILVLLKELKAGYHLAYVPHGPGQIAFRRFREASVHSPGCPDAESGFIQDDGLLSLLGKALKKSLGLRLLALRFDLDWEFGIPDPEAPKESPAPESPTDADANSPGHSGKEAPDETDQSDSFNPEELRRKLRIKGLVKASADIQPPDTVIVDLRHGEEGVLGAMKPKTRYNARLAGKKGVAIRHGSLDDLETWYALYEETARRDRIGIHGKEYYRRLLADNPENCVLLMAEHEGDPLAGTIVLTNKSEATYLYGASSNIKRNLMPAYALQWEGMRLALSRACTRYDLFGIPPSADPGHPMHGLYQFKTGFGGRLVHRAGTWDLVCSPIAYNAFRIYESLRFWILRRLKKQFS